MSLLRGKRFGTLLKTYAAIPQLQLSGARPLNISSRCRYATQIPHVHSARAGIFTSSGRSHSTKVDGATNAKEEPVHPGRVAQTLRECMRSIQYPVAIITSTDVGLDPKGGLESWRGLTVSSFTTVSMSPRPMVSFNVHEKSSTLGAIHNSGMFAVHLLSNTPEAVEIATRFARPMDREQFKQELRGQSIYAGDSNRWRTSDTGAGTNPGCLPPKLQWIHPERPRAVMLQIMCKASQDLNVKVGDHVVVFGEVQLVLNGKDNEKEGRVSGDSTVQDCLTYSHGRYNVD